MGYSQESMHNNANMAAKFLPKLSKSQQNVACRTFQLLSQTKMGNYA